MDRGGVHVAQPDVGRVGGLTEARRVCDMAAERGLADRAARLEDRPHGRGDRAAGGGAPATCRSSSSCRRRWRSRALRRDLVADELELVDGHLALPARPGLGVEPDAEALERFEREALARYP